MDNYHSLCHQEAHLYGALMLYTSNAIYRQLNAALRSHFGKTNNLQLGTWQKPGVYVGLIGLIGLICSVQKLRLNLQQLVYDLQKKWGLHLDFHAVIIHVTTSVEAPV